MSRPVFVVGCPRSGTTLLYSMLIAAGGFAVYRKETHFYELAPRFPTLTGERSQQEFCARFLAGYLGQVPGLDVGPLLRSALERAPNPAAVLPLLMDGIAKAQSMSRWVEATPVHVLNMADIERAVPGALFVHVIRDGRDCAVSQNAQHWIPTLPWDRSRRLGVAALYWEWMTRAGRDYCTAHPERCVEVRFESLIAEPRATLERLGRFLDHDLDYDRIQANPVHALRVPNTSFRAERKRSDFNPVARWKHKIPENDLRLCEALIGPLLEELGYELSRSHRHDLPVRARAMRATYLPYFALKQWLKTSTPAGRFLTSTRVWNQPARAGEERLLPMPSTDTGGA